MARPTKLTPEMIEAAKRYLEDYESHGDVFPSAVGMSHAIGVAKSTLYEWEKREDGGFSDILRQCHEDYERVLLNKGITGEFNSAITKLALGKAGYSDKQELTGNDGKDLLPPSFICEYVGPKPDGSD